MKSRSWEVWDKEHVARIAKDGWGKSAEYHKGLIVGRVLDETEGDSVLDVGCGVGRYASFYRHLPPMYLGVDSSDEMLAVARQRYPEMVFKRGDIYDLSGVPDADTVIAIAVLIHMPDVESAVRELWGKSKRCLMVTVTIQKGGRFGERDTYTRNGVTAKFPPGKRIIARAEDRAEFENLLQSLEPSDIQSWPFDSVRLYKVTR
jgi:ubiquinone/menaquinone biosynthesis C-methylase UbiE